MEDKVKGTLQDLASNFLYYDRKEDEDLTREDIEEMFKSGGLTVDECASAFKEAMKDCIKANFGV